MLTSCNSIALIIVSKNVLFNNFFDTISAKASLKGFPISNESISASSSFLCVESEDIQSKVKCLPQ